MIWTALLALVSLAASAAPNDFPGAGNLRITPEMLRFNYYRFDGEHAASCKHVLEDPAAQDWRVSCEDGEFRREYRVHLWVTVYSRAVVPRLSYEVLYWVTDLSVPGTTSGSGTTMWFHLKDPSTLHSIGVSQSVENDQAGLYLDLEPGKGTLKEKVWKNHR